jgi:hypothetical protein
VKWKTKPTTFDYYHRNKNIQLNTVTCEARGAVPRPLAAPPPAESSPHGGGGPSQPPLELTGALRQPPQCLPTKHMSQLFRPLDSSPLLSSSTITLYPFHSSPSPQMSIILNTPPPPPILLSFSTFSPYPYLSPHSAHTLSPFHCRHSTHLTFSKLFPYSYHSPHSPQTLIVIHTLPIPLSFSKLYPYSKRFHSLPIPLSFCTFSPYHTGYHTIHPLYAPHTVLILRTLRTPLSSSRTLPIPLSFSTLSPKYYHFQLSPHTIVIVHSLPYRSLHSLYNLIILQTIPVPLSLSMHSPHTLINLHTLLTPFLSSSTLPIPYHSPALSPYPIILHTLPITLSFSIRSSYRYHPPPHSPHTLIISTRSPYPIILHTLPITLSFSIRSSYRYHPPPHSPHTLIISTRSTYSYHLSHNYLPITYHLSYLRIQFLPHSHPPYHQQSSRYYPQPCHILKNTPHGLIFSIVCSCYAFILRIIQLLPPPLLFILFLPSPYQLPSFSHSPF